MRCDSDKPASGAVLMSADVIGTAPKPLLTPRRARRILAALLVLGVVSFAAVYSSLSEHPPECSAFTFGWSAFGGCDGFGGPPKTP
jgi:hypothetical protein